MIKEYYEPIPYGDTIPLNNPHAFSVSMPRIQDVIDYEESTEQSKNIIKSAYPRIVIHPYIQKVCKIAALELNITNEYLYLLPSITIAQEVSELSETSPEYNTFKEYAIVSFGGEKLEDAKKYFSFMKHCGFMIFSREAEDILISLGEPFDNNNEEYIKDNSESVIKTVLEEGYGSRDITISNCGMNSIYAGFNGIKKDGIKKNRSLFIIYGWAYADTLDIFKKCTDEYILFTDVTDTGELERFLEERGDEVAGVYLETVSNPLITVPDIPGIYKLSEKYGFYVMIDNTFATPWLVDISNYCDIIFESLTKFASGSGDVMAGAIIIPGGSRLDSKLLNKIRESSHPLYKRDLNRLAYSIKGYKKRVLTISENSYEIERYLLNMSSIKTVYSVNNDKNIDNWKKIVIGEYTCGVISILFNGKIENHYDKINLPKGPSLGSEFPILMPYTLLAHYDETKSVHGLEYLYNIGLHPDLLRLSVGVDDPLLTIKELCKN